MNQWQGRLGRAARRIASMPHAPAGAAVVLGLIGAAETLAWARSYKAPTGQSYSGEGQAALMLLSLATTVPLGLLWTQPAVAATVVAAACLLSLLIFHLLAVAGLVAALAALYRLGRRGSPQFLAVGLAAPFLVLALAYDTRSQAQVDAVALAVVGQAAAWSGIAVRARVEAARHSAARHVIAGSLLEHTARGERVRISRELHDVVAHHISMIAVQAETARLTTPGLPAAGADRLSAIGDTARTALTEMRRLLGVLREDTGPDPADLRPQPGLGQLNELLDEARDVAQASTRLIISGSPVALDPVVELAGYRIIQEALTNSRRHAPGAAVDVELRYSAGTLLVRVRDNGPGPADRPPPGEATVASGHGLPGMRERAVAAGGSLHTGPAPGGGFLVEATLPALQSPAYQPRAEVAG